MIELVVLALGCAALGAVAFTADQVFPALLFALLTCYIALATIKAFGEEYLRWP